MSQSQGSPVAEPSTRAGWTGPALRVAVVLLAGFVAWYVANHWDRWSGSARFARTDDAAMAGDLTPLAAKVSGYVVSVAVADFQAVKQGDVLVEIDPADYRAQVPRSTRATGSTGVAAG